MDMNQLMPQLIKIYNNRLKIMIIRNGITFIEDIRDRNAWTRELLRMHETAVLEELPPSYVLPKLMSEMEELPQEERDQIIRDYFGDVYAENN